MNDRGGMGMVKFRRWLKVSNPWVWPIFLFLAFFVIFPLVKLFVDSFTTADVPLSPLREAIMTVDLMEEKIASGDEEEAKAALDDLLVQIERSETSITRTTAALGAALTSQQKSIDRWNEVLSELGVIKSALAGMTTPEEATGEARKLKELMSKAVQLPNKAFSVKFFFDVFKDKVYMKALVNSLTLGFASVVTSSIIGFSVAYLLVRYEFPGRKLFNFLTMIPIVMPPLVGVLGFIFILGRGGTVNELFYLFAQKIELTWPALSNWLFDHLPFNFVYGWHGLLMVETLHLFPLITLNMVDSLSKIDASLEEAAESMGSVGFKRLFDITIPLTVPGFVTGALLVFIWAFADFATPHVVGLNNFIAPLAFMDIQQFIDRNLFKMGITVGAVMVMWSIVFLIVAKKYVSMKDY
ncbi:MAG TPA: ABC transporter permease subunit, partial [Bacillota bacterium]|nr:ABC transporter permease subunit [Bacillota bacterium]